MHKRFLAKSDLHAPTQMEKAVEERDNHHKIASNAEYRSYIIILCISAFLFSIILSSINYNVDPYDIFLNNKTGMYFYSEREFKRSYVKKDNYDCILMGSSKVNNIPTNHIKDIKIFNAGFPGALPEEMFFLLRDINPKTSYLLLGLDFFMFNENIFPLRSDPTFLEKYLNKFKYLFSVSTFYKSIKSVYFYLKGEMPHIRLDGAPGDVNLQSIEDDYNKPRKQHTPNRNFFGYQFSKKRLEYLKSIKIWCFTNKVKLIVWINPYHKKSLEYIKENYGEPWEKFLMEIKEIFPLVLDLSTSKYSHEKYFWSYDFYHYYPTTGVRMLKEIIESQGIISSTKKEND